MRKATIGEAVWITVRITDANGAILDWFETNDDQFADRRIANVVRWCDDATVERIQRRAER